MINVARGSLVDEKALIEALRNKTILAAGLDVFENEPSVPQELIALENTVLLPHVGSASVRTRRAMAECVVSNLFAWADGKPPLTPVPETPWRGQWGRADRTAAQRKKPEDPSAAGTRRTVRSLIVPEAHVRRRQQPCMSGRQA